MGHQADKARDSANQSTPDANVSRPHLTATDAGDVPKTVQAMHRTQHEC
jgi:hypothetical protein